MPSVRHVGYLWSERTLRAVSTLVIFTGVIDARLTLPLLNASLQLLITFSLSGLLRRVTRNDGAAAPVELLI